MKVSQLLRCMEKEENIIINDEEDDACLYRGCVKGIKRDDYLNKYHIKNVFAFDDEIVVFAVEPKRKGGAE